MLINPAQCQLRTTERNKTADIARGRLSAKNDRLRRGETASRGVPLSANRYQVCPAKECGRSPRAIAASGVAIRRAASRWSRQAA